MTPAKLPRRSSPDSSENVGIRRTIQVRKEILEKAWKRSQNGPGESLESLEQKDDKIPQTSGGPSVATLRSTWWSQLTCPSLKCIFRFRPQSTIAGFFPDFPRRFLMPLTLNGSFPYLMENNESCGLRRALNYFRVYDIIFREFCLFLIKFYLLRQMARVTSVVSNLHRNNPLPFTKTADTKTSRRHDRPKKIGTAL